MIKLVFRTDNFIFLFGRIDFGKYGYQTELYIWFKMKQVMQIVI